MTALERRAVTPCMFVTLERGLPGPLFLCAFTPNGEHVNLGDGHPFCTAQSFVRAFVPYACKQSGVSASDVQRLAP